MSSHTLTPESGWIERLPDGSNVHIRPIARQDAELELAFLRELSPEFRNARFLGLAHDPSPEVARALTEIDPTHAVALIAVILQDGREREVGAAQFHASGDVCEASLTVSGEWRRRGVGSALMQHLIQAARARGLRRMRAYGSMRSPSGDHLALRLGFQPRPNPDDPATSLLELDLQA